MIEKYTDNTAYKSISIMLVGFTLFVMTYITYVSYYNVLSKLLSNHYLNEIIIKLHTNKPNPIINKLVVIGIMASAILTFSPTKTTTEEEKGKNGAIGSVLLFIFFIQGIIEFYYGNFGVLGLLLHLVFFFSSFYFLLEWRKKIAEDLKKDRRNIVESQFDQQRELLDTEFSVNIKYAYTYLGENLLSWINIVNPFRGNLVGGSPGSGKSFAIIEEFFRQLIRKGFTGVVYDFKYPTLSTKVYNYMKWYQDSFAIKPKFFAVNFDDARYSHRCNPINIDSLESIADAEESTRVLMLNINKTWIEKEGDFFTDSANVFTAMLLWYNKLATVKYDYNVCTLPHLVALSTFESTEILFFILQEYPDLKAKMKPFSEALEKGALEQLAGQVASAGVALSKITSIELNYILSGDDLTLDLNNPLSPKILALGNNPERQDTYGAPLGLILTKLSKTLNKQDRLPSMFAVDEFPTVYVRGIDNLIATARSNKVATLLGFQSFAQIVADYGQQIADKIIRLCGTRIMGQMLDDDAETVSKNIGQQKVMNKSYNYSNNDVTEGNQVNFEDIVPSAHITQFSQGTFCGFVADDFKYKEANKIFYGECMPPLALKEREEDLSLPKIYDFNPPNFREVVLEYIEENIKMIVDIINLVVSRSKIEWIDLMEELTTQADFNKFIISSSKNLPENETRSFLELIIFRKSLGDYIQKGMKSIKGKNEIVKALELHLTEDQAKEYVHDAIFEGFEIKFKNEYLTEYQNQIYDDVYKIIALEIKELDIIEKIRTNGKLKISCINFFTRIVNSDRLKSKLIRDEYQNFIFELQV